jgi:hypothetical protein
MATPGRGLCSNCQCKTVEFVIAFSGPSACSAADVCRYDEPGFPWKIYCDKYQAVRSTPATEHVAAANGTGQKMRVQHAN